jgi:hypothetical protein
MKLLVATERTQGDMAGDYTYCVPGELLWITMVCGRDRRDPEQGCGCGRGFGGLTSHRATTTAEVVERDFPEYGLRLAISTSLTDQGWLRPDASVIERTRVVDEVIADIMSIVEPLPVGTIVRRSVDDFHAFPPQRRS